MCFIGPRHGRVKVLEYFGPAAKTQRKIRTVTHEQASENQNQGRLEPQRSGEIEQKTWILSSE